MRIESEKAYNQLISNDKIPKNLINHKYFRETFIHEYDLYLDAHRGNLPKIEILEDGSIYLSDSILDKDTTNGVYVGVYSNNTCKFSIENFNNKEYLGIERVEDFQYKIPKGYKMQNGQVIDYDFVTSSLRKSMAAYSDVEQLGYISFVSEENIKNKILGTPTSIVGIPDLKVENAINGSIVASNNLYGKNYRVDGIFRSRQYHGLLEYCSVEKLSYQNQAAAREITERRIVDLNHEHPYLLSNVSLWSPIAYQYNDSRFPEQNKDTFSNPSVIFDLEERRNKNIEKYYKEKPILNNNIIK